MGDCGEARVFLVAWYRPRVLVKRATPSCEHREPPTHSLACLVTLPSPPAAGKLRELIRLFGILS